jgi:hypothetical protein
LAQNCTTKGLTQAAGNDSGNGNGKGMVLVMVSQNHLQLVKFVGNSHLGEHDVHRACD